VRVRGATVEEALARLALALGTVLTGGEAPPPAATALLEVAGGADLAGSAVALLRALLHALGVSERALGARPLYDVCHNVAKHEAHEVEGVTRPVLLHRKGATRAFGPGDPRVPAPYRAVGQPVLIPGDMGRSSYVLVGAAQAMRDRFGSSCHGAGRLRSRGEALRRSRGRSIAGGLASRGIEVMGRARKTLGEEMSEAYEGVAQVVGVMHGAGISRLVARLEPVGVIKG